MKLSEEAEPELKRLGAEAENAYNWKVEKACHQTRSAFHAAMKVSREGFNRIYEDLEKIMSISD